MARPSSIAPKDCNEKLIDENTTLVKFTDPIEVGKPAKAIGVIKKEKTRDSPFDVNPETQSILNLICPIHEFEADGKLWRQQVSIEPATRADVQKLSENLKTQLKLRQARTGGICSIRLELFSQLFDELIRQVTINCAERGLLLLRIRDELKLSLATHHALYESSIDFAIKKAAEAQEGQFEHTDDLITLVEEKNQLEKEINELNFKYKMMEIRAEEIKQAQVKRHKNEAAFLQKTNQQLKDLRERLDYCFIEAEEPEESETVVVEGTTGVDYCAQKVEEDLNEQLIEVDGSTDT